MASPGAVPRVVAMVAGWILVVAGVLGFLPPFHPVLLVLGVNVAHNLVHFLTGAALLAGAYVAGGAYARPMNVAVGLVYAVVAFLGFAGVVVPGLLNLDADLVPHASNVAHLLLAVVFLGTAFVGARQEARLAHPGL